MPLPDCTAECQDKDIVLFLVVSEIMDNVLRGKVEELENLV